MPPGRTINIYPDTGPGVSQSGQSSSSSSQSSQSSQPQAQTTQVQAGGQTGATVEPEEPEETVEVEETTYSRPLPAVPDIYYDELTGAVRKRGETLYTVQVDDARGILKAKDVQFTVTKVKRTRPPRVTIGRPPRSYKEQPLGLEAAKKFNGIDFTPGGATKVIKEDVETFWRSLPAIPDILYSGHIEGAVRKRGGTTYQATKGGVITAFITAWDTPVTKRTIRFYPQGVPKAKQSTRLTPTQIKMAEEAYKQMLKSMGRPVLAIGKLPKGPSPTGTMTTSMIERGAVGKSQVSHAFIEGLKVGVGSLAVPVVEAQSAKHNFLLTLSHLKKGDPTKPLKQAFKPDIDVRELNPGEAAAFYIGRLVPTAIASYFGSMVLGMGVGEALSSEAALTLGSKAEPLMWSIRTSRFARPSVAAATKGTLKGVIVGGLTSIEAIKAYEMNRAGYKPYQIGMDIASDIVNILAFTRGFGSGFRKTYRPLSMRNTDIIIERQTPEGVIREYHKIRNGEYVEGGRVVDWDTGRMRYFTMSKFKPSQGYMVAGVGEGARDVKFLLVEGAKGATPFRTVVEDAANPMKYWKYAQGGRRMFYLYDPLKGEAVQLPKVPTELKSLINTAKPRPAMLGGPQEAPMFFVPAPLMAPPVEKSEVKYSPERVTAVKILTGPTGLRIKEEREEVITTLRRGRITPPSLLSKSPGFAPPSSPHTGSPEHLRPTSGHSMEPEAALAMPTLAIPHLAPNIETEAKTEAQVQTQVLSRARVASQTQMTDERQEPVVGTSLSFVLMQIPTLTPRQEQFQVPIPPSEKPPEKPAPPKPPKPPLIIPGRKGKGALPSFGALFKRSWASYVGYESLLSPRRSGKKSRKSKRPSMPKRPRLVPPKLPKFSPPRLLPGR